MRIEQDKLGREEIPDELPLGLNTIRASRNYPESGEKINPYLIRAYLWVKLAAAIANLNAGLLSKEKFGLIKTAVEKLTLMADSAIAGKSEDIYKLIIVDPYQGGAGTSLNMNINELIANTALKLSGRNYGDYNFIHPLDHVNKSQSTNDTFGTAAKVAAIQILRILQNSFATLQNELQKKESEVGGIIKLGRTQLQDAVPLTLGSEFGAFAQAVARDRWRIYNAEERLRSVNLGGTAVGTSITADNKYVLNVVNELRIISGLPIAKAEDLIEATQNLDVVVEVHGIVKAGAVSVMKICNDLRLLSSGPNGGIGEIILPKLQAGSTIMPGKVNPVILENTIQICELVKGHDAMIANLASQGNLELNQFAPMIVHLLLKSFLLFSKALLNLTEKCISGIKADRERCRENLLRSSASAAAFINKFGYDKIAAIVTSADDQKIRFVDVLKIELGLSDEQFNQILKSELGVDDELGS